MRTPAIILSALLCMASRHPDRMIRADIVFNASFNRGDASDRSMYAATPTLAGNAVVTAGNRYLSLDGSGDWVTTTDAAGLDVGSAFSVSFWVQPNAPGTGSNRTPVARWANSIAKSSWVCGLRYAETPQRVLLATSANGALLNTLYYFNMTLPTSGWHHFVCVFDNAAGAAQRWKLYYDGAAVAYTTNAADTSGTPFATDIGVRVGNDNDGTASAAWKGDVDEVRIYNRALSAAEVAAIYSSGRE